MTNLQVMWVLLQGVFLPAIWFMDRASTRGEYILTGIVFFIYEALVLVDALLFVKVFNQGKKVG